MLPAADWVTSRGDAQNSGYQLNEKQLSEASVARLRLLWKKQVGGEERLPSDPLILGPFVTHRGIKEVVFSVSDGLVYAIDADLGTTLWKRSFERDEQKVTDRDCSERRVTPAMSVPSVPPRERGNEEEEFSDGNRPLFVFAPSGKLFKLRPSTGEDFETKPALLSGPNYVTALKVVDELAYIQSAESCDSAPDQVWSLPAAAHTAARLPSAELDRWTTKFDWRGKRLLVKNVSQERLAIMEVSGRRSLAESEPFSSGKTFGVTTWSNRTNDRFVCASSLAELACFGLSKDSQTGRMILEKVWSTPDRTPAGAPVGANGLVYVLGRPKMESRQEINLSAFDARNGHILYTSESIPAPDFAVSNLALANGHLTFSTKNDTTYCFGIPVEQ